MFKHLHYITFQKSIFVPNLIRMDVEGHECEIISGMLKHIENGYFKPHICFEPHITSYSKNNKFSNTLRKLFNLGYYTNLCHLMHKVVQIEFLI